MGIVSREQSYRRTFGKLIVSRRVRVNAGNSWKFNWSVFFFPLSPPFCTICSLCNIDRTIDLFFVKSYASLCAIYRSGQLIYFSHGTRRGMHYVFYGIHFIIISRSKIDASLIINVACNFISNFREYIRCIDGAYLRQLFPRSFLEIQRAT